MAGLYLPSARNDFVYDDHLLIVNAPAPRSAADVARVFAERHWHNLPYYRPLARLTMVVQKGVHGDRPAPYHLFNAFLMGTAAVLAHGLLARPVFGIRPVPAVLGAALFGLHPIASDTVYPICSGRETLMPAVFTLAAVGAFLRPGRGWYLVAALLLGGALLSKEQAIVVPALFVLADALGISSGSPGRRLRGWVARHAPFLLLVAAYLLLRRQVLGGAGEYRLAVLDDPSVPLASLAYALQTIAAPFVEVVYEPRLEVWPSVWRQLAWLAAAVPLAVAAHRRWPAVRSAVLFWLGWFVLTLLPTANLLRQEARFAERYGFLALLGVVGVVAVVVSSAWERARVRRLATAGGMVLLAACAAISVHRGRYFANDLGFLRQWLRTDPDSAEAHYNLANLLQAAERLDEALDHYRRAVALAPDSAEIHNNLGIALGRAGDVDGAAAHYGEAVRLKPDYAIAHNNLGTALRSKGQLEAAARHFHRALRSDPALVQARENLASTHHDLAGAFLQQGRLDEAIRHYRGALALAPRSVETRGDLGWALSRAGLPTPALDQFRRAVALDPDGPSALAGMAWILATHPDPHVREPAEAVRLAGRAADLTGHRQVRILDVLAAAHAAAGEFDQAVATATEALRLATAAGADELAAAVAERLALYRDRRPYREP